MEAPAAVLAVVLLEAAVGGSAVLWMAPTWGAVRHGYEILLGATLGFLSLAALAAMRAPLNAVADSAPVWAAWTARGLAVTTAAAVASPILIAVRAPFVGRLAGIAATLLGIMTFVPLAQLRAGLGRGGAGVATGVLELMFGAFFLGAVVVGLVLGHWYLIERRLSNRYMLWIAWLNVAAVAAGLGSIVLSIRNPVPCAGLAGLELQNCLLTYSPLLSVGSVTVVMGIGLLAVVAMIAAFNVRLAWEGGRSIQASTGMFYLAVILAPAAEFAAKVRFF
ncbi:MAG: hypothetical protein M3252_01085 [Actinomycetota bacterium]|nr:hypothetical protein [Actinomycetota bacterium]